MVNFHLTTRRNISENIGVELYELLAAVYRIIVRESSHVPDEGLVLSLVTGTYRRIDTGK